MPWKAPRMWPDAKVFIIGGGPSIRDMDLSPLERHRVIGCNNAALDFGCRVVDVALCRDRPWWDQYGKRIKAYSGLVITCMRGLDDRRIKVMNLGRFAGIDDRPDHLVVGSNVGHQAINLAIHFGAKRIVLVGFDMRRVDGLDNYHNQHYRKMNENVHNEHIRSMQSVVGHLPRFGVEVVNATPGSALTCFPMTDFVGEVAA